MSATRTLTVIGPFTAGSKFGYQDAQALKEAQDQAAYCGLTTSLGGSEVCGLVTGAATWVPAANYLAYTLNGDSLGGLVLEAVVYYYTTDASTAVQVRIRNTTDNSPAATGTSSTSTTVVTETLTLTLASGNKSYRLEVLGDATNAVVAWGFLRIKATPS